MSYLGKNYTLVKQENFDGFLKSIGLPDDKIQFLLKSNASQKLIQNGESYTFFTLGTEGPKEVIFKSGVEFDDVVADNTPVKTTYTVDGNTVTQVVTGSAGTVTFKREYVDDELVVTITSDFWDGVSKRYYKV